MVRVIVWTMVALLSAVFVQVGRAQCPPVEVAELLASDGEPYDTFGRSVAIEGDTAIIGAPGADGVGAEGTGAAYVFTRSAGVWSETAKLSASDGTSGSLFGCAVRLDGDTAVIGAFAEDQYVGSAYVFVRSEGTWTQQAKLTASDGANDDHFGWSVAIDDDTAAVGALLDDNDGGGSAGAAYVFVRSGTEWTQQAKLTAADGGAGDDFGNSVFLQADTLLVSAALADVAGMPNAGACYVFLRSGSTWSQQAKLVASDASPDALFGGPVLDGDTAVITATGAPPAGAAYVFLRSGPTWTELTKLTASDGAPYDDFGASRSLDGDAVVIGAPKAYSDWGDTGAAYLFLRRGESWTQAARLIASDARGGDRFGGSVRIDGGTFVVGAELKNRPARPAAGAAYVFDLLPLADLDCDADVDLADYLVFLAAFGRCDGDGMYNIVTDYDRDGCTTLVDYQIWWQYYMAAEGDLPGPLPVVLPADLNCDGHVNFGDINPFVLALGNPVAYGANFPDCDITNADINCDGHVDFGDINPFVALLSGSP